MLPAIKIEYELHVILFHLSIPFLRRVHDGAIFTLCTLKDGSILSGGGKDGRIVYFDADLNPSGIETEIEHHFGSIRIIAEGKGSQLLIGTTRNCILTGNLELGFSPVIMGHTDELWGLAVHPNMPQFVTGGRDRLLQLWDSLSHSVVWSKDIGEQIQSCAFSSDGSWIAVGTLIGKLIVFDTQTRDMLTQHTDGQEPISTIEFSPDGKLLAIGSHDNNIYIYQISDSQKRFAKIGRCYVSTPSDTRRRTFNINSIFRFDCRVIQVLSNIWIGQRTVKLFAVIREIMRFSIVSSSNILSKLHDNFNDFDFFGGKKIYIRESNAVPSINNAFGIV